MNDDWSYIWSAKLLAQSGHIRYSGWAQPILGWQLYLAALLIKVFGFSFSIVRCSVLLIAAATAFLLQRSLVRAGLRSANASFATLCVLASPLYLPLAFSFMSDAGGLFSILLCLYSCLRAFQARTDRGAFAWWTFAAVSNVLTGTVRQIAWLGLLVMVPSAGWYLRTRLPRRAAVAIYLASAGAVFGCMSWFSHQPYAMREPLFDFYPDRDAAASIVSGYTHAVLGLGFFLLPILAAFLFRFSFRRSRVTFLLLLCFAVASILVSVFPHGAAAHCWLIPFLPNYVTERGLVQIGAILGQPPLIVPLPVQVLLTIFSFASSTAFLLWLVDSPGQRAPALVAAPARISTPSLRTLLLPFAAAYGFLLISRAAKGALYDRYLFPLLVIAIIFIVRSFQDLVAPRMPIACMLLLAASALFGVTGLHDLFAMERARLIAIAELHAAGLPDTAFYGGYEYDGWTQLLQAGYVNSAQMVRPREAWHPPSPFLAGHPCGYHYAHLVPVIEARYVLSFDRDGCAGPTAFAPVTFSTWLPPFDQTIYVDRMKRRPPESAPLDPHQVE